MDFKGKSIISIRDVDTDAFDMIITTARRIKEGEFAGCLKNKLLATLFFEPSTRTRLSFESAMRYLGGEVIGFSGTDYTSVKKGETLTDTVITVAGYCDAIVIRHPVEGAARLASEISSVPVINAGDGANQHPTQTFLDLFTLSEFFSRLSDVRIGFLGDLKYGRTVHSLAYALSLYKTPMWFIAPDLLKMPAFLTAEIKQNGSTAHETEDLEGVNEKLDVLYVTRIQKERFGDMQEYERVAGCYRVTNKIVETLGRKVKIMHPLPRVDEIAREVDDLENALYFHQAHNGIPVRQAVLGLVLGAIR